ncbi:HesA/MoeB/ThiF family protein [Pseudothermotoga lettingae]|uniref:UBA/THIF-type NAD/FAD binding protein n=1 Tax=Pseudothermotoga lettingae (strain ATCC BAA-301 / DSM 14385 / NBRC 107922 / TMO) TaxID=416591 RepID=A8F412_PSELT|nr:HesA/MoeB/ThiF family protein [Pseudothermotoga lettingae]ABV32896.1 UBA/THIF-type NAD/FAD binding protein [Pseudothermotoga lettingae TMO]GLI48105.1 thiazole biosynthesis protein ThiF [Pseudothermotoga lettingae TMO]
MFQRHSELLKDCMQKLFKSTIFVAGAGGLGCTVLSLIVRIGVKNIYLIDHGIVDEPDLNRQILYDRNDLGKSKVKVAGEKLKMINPECNLITIDKTLDEKFILPAVDIVIDCLEGFRSKLILDDLCQRKSIPLVHAGVGKFSGQVMTLMYNGGPTLKELYRGAVEEDKERQIFPPAVVLTAALQVSEMTKIICNKGDILNGKILQINLLQNHFDFLNLF